MFCIFALKSVLNRFLMPNRLHLGSEWRSFGRLFAPKVTILRGMVAICGICVRYAVYMGSGWGSRIHSSLEDSKWRVIGSRRGPLATSKQIAGRPENRKTEIRTPQYARRQDWTLQNGTEWQEDKTGNAIPHSRVPRGAGGFSSPNCYSWVSQPWKNLP